MPDLKDSVGDGGVNKVHDVTLVQAMLIVINDAKGSPYLNASYDGSFGNATKAAISAFQKDFNLAKLDNSPALPTAVDKLGFIDKSSATFKKMVALLPKTHSSITIMENTHTAYLEGGAEDGAAAVNAILSTEGLENTFRGKVATLVKQMYARNKIVLTVAPQGARRTFQEQFLIPAANTKAGPSESNHNFGRAVDIGFNKIRIVAADGSIFTDDWWLQNLKVEAKTSEFWAARDQIAVSGDPGLFNGPSWDKPHLQAYSDQNVNMRRSLALLLSQSGRQFKWNAAAGGYQTDLGLGGVNYDVGTSKQIWGLQGTVNKKMAAVWLTADLVKQAQVKGPASVSRVKPVVEADVTATQLDLLRTTLKSEFVAAEKNFAQWAPTG